MSEIVGHSHFVFLESWRPLEGALIGSYNATLVIFSILVAAIASYTAFLLSERVSSSRKKIVSILWLLIGASSLGMGIWSMHFVGMLAFILPVPISYDATLTFVSVTPAFLASIIVLYPKQFSINYHLDISIKSILCGGGIGAMHYMGMSAMRMDAIMRYDSTFFLLSIFVAVILAYIALELKRYTETVGFKRVPVELSFVLSSVVMGMAISGMHYTGMASVHYFPSSVAVEVAEYWEADKLANIIVGTVIALFMLLIFVVHLSRRFDLLRRLRKSEKQVRLLMGSTAEAIYGTDVNGICTFVNPACEEMLGYKDSELLGQDIYSLIYYQDKDKGDASFKHSNTDKMINGEGVHVDHESFRRSDGTCFQVEYWLHPVFDDGEVVGAVTTFLDITDRRKTENELHAYRRHLEEMVHERTEALKKALERAESASKSKSEFLSQMSHELRTPLNAVIGFSHILGMNRENNLTELQKENLSEIKNAGEHLLSVINELLDLARIESGRLEVSIEVVDINDVVSSCVGLIQAQANDRQVKINNEVHEHDYVVRADAIRLKQVVLNLLSNAVKYNVEGGSVTISGQPINSGVLRIEVVDTGKGIGEELQHKLFVPFERMHANKNIEGSGIGLAITKNLIELMGGRIGYKSELGVGSTFWIELEHIGENDADKESDKDTDEQSVIMIKHFKILYVEDNLVNVKMIKQALSNRQDIRLIAVGSGAEGIETYLNYEPDLMLVDIHLPDMTGYEMVDTIKNMQPDFSIPVYALSASSDAGRSRARGFNDFFSKPLDVDRFLAEIDKYIFSDEKKPSLFELE